MDDSDSATDDDDYNNYDEDDPDGYEDGYEDDSDNNSDYNSNYDSDNDSNYETGDNNSNDDNSSNYETDDNGNDDDIDSNYETDDNDNENDIDSNYETDADADAVTYNDIDIDDDKICELYKSLYYMYIFVVQYLNKNINCFIENKLEFKIQMAVINNELQRISNILNSFL
ncbi:variant-silencing SET domain-containing protein-like [Homarus americanus]|uniref:variant-silencing SET domain-containing protein-like n=1 Tax=Homarus americanus TaxID=6706 RepID=UPI001C475078|nr:variant-silencing SET domain-containing protein-like [Homarus americanus]